MSEDLLSNSKQLLEDSIFKVGKVVSVKGRSIEILVDKAKNSSNLLYKGELIKNVSVGGYVKIIKGYTKIIGKVEGEYIKEEKDFSTKEYSNPKEKISRILNVSLLGFFGDRGFERGIKELPLIDNESFLLKKNEFNAVHHFVKEKDEPLTLGALSLEKGQEIKVGIDSLFASHIGIFGNTGSGKSYTLAKIYRRLFVKYQEKKKFKENAKFIIYDFNGEYSDDDCIVSNKKIYNLTTGKSLDQIDKTTKFPIKEKDLIDIELLSILANATEKTQKPFLSRTIRFYKDVIKDTNPINYFQNTLKKRIREFMKMKDKEKADNIRDYLINILEPEGISLSDLFDREFEWHYKQGRYKIRGEGTAELTKADIEGSALYKYSTTYSFPDNVLTKVIHFLYLQLIYDIYYNKAENKHISPAINKLKSKSVDIQKVINTEANDKEVFEENNIVVVNLDDVNLDMKKTLPLIISKKLYSEHKKEYKKNENKSLNIIIDEAHNILSMMSFREAENWKDYRLETFEEIIKEGRKFGVFLTLASQRPHDISPTIVSQLHNFFLHRLINNKDIEAIARTVSYLDNASFEFMSILPTGSCIMAGLMAQVPVIVDIGKIEPDIHKPNNETISLVKAWKEEILSEDEVNDDEDRYYDEMDDHFDQEIEDDRFW